MANNLKGFGKELSQSLPYGFTKEKHLLFQFIEGGDVVNLYRLTEGLFELYGDQQMLDLIVSIGKRLPPETFTWLVNILSIEADRIKVESSVNPELCSRPVWQYQFDEALGTLIKQGHLEITGWDDDFIFSTTKKGRKYLAALRDKLSKNSNLPVFSVE